jgi:long-chain fatty acid transport protein
MIRRLQFGLNGTQLSWFAKCLIAGIGLIVVMFNNPTIIRAQGIFLTGTGPVNQGMGGAAVAAPLDVTGAINWNPATISGLPSSQIEIGLGVVLPTETVSSQAFGFAGTTQGEPGATPVPNMSFVLKDDCSPCTWGVGIYGVGGFSSNYPASSLSNPTSANPIFTPPPPNGVGVGRVYTNAEIYQIAPAMSLALTDHLSIGFAPTVDVALVQTDPLLFAPVNVVQGSATYGPGDGTRFSWGGGFDIGAFYTTDYGWNFGVSYKSTQWFEPLRFNSNNQLGEPVFNKIHAQLPQFVSIGTAFTGWKRAVWATDVRFVDYADTQGFGGSGFRPDGSVIGLGWRNVVAVATGLQYQLTDCLKVRCGYTFVENPIPNAQEEVNLGTSLIMEHFLSIGASYWIRQCVAIDIAYTHGFENSLSGPFVAPATGPIAGTNITSTVSADHLTLGLSVRF